MNVSIDYKDLKTVIDLAKKMSVNSTPKVVYKHPARDNYNIIFSSTFFRSNAHNNRWAVCTCTNGKVVYSPEWIEKKTPKILKSAYLIVMLDKETNGLIDVDIWSHEPWHESILYNDRYYYVAFSTKQKTFSEAEKAIRTLVADPVCSLHYLYEHLNKERGLHA